MPNGRARLALFLLGVLVAIEPAAARDRDKAYRNKPDVAPQSGYVVRRPDGDGNRCGRGEALSRARGLGLRGAQVIRVGPRSIQVRGRLDDRTVVLTIARLPGCPVLAF